MISDISRLTMLGGTSVPPMIDPLPQICRETKKETIGLALLGEGVV